MKLWSLFGALRRRWWVPVGATLLAVILAAILLPPAPYEITVRATVVIAGDTENPGRAERPELMVLDDIPPVIESRAYAELVQARIDPGQSIDVDDVLDAISGSRYSRIAMITIQGDDPDDLVLIASAVVETFPTAVNTFIVAPDDVPATVQIIDGAASPSQPTLVRRLTVAVIGGLALFGSIFGIWLAGSMRRERQVAEAK